MHKDEENAVVFKYSIPSRLIPLFLSLEIFLFAFLFYFYPPYPFDNNNLNAIPFFIQFKILMVAVAFIISVWILRFFFHMRFSFEIGDDSVMVISGKSEKKISYDLIDSIDYENMLGPSRGLFGSTVIRVRGKGYYRIFNVMNGGDRFIKLFIEKACAKPFERKDLKSWVEIRRIDKKMGKSIIYIRIWYYLMVAAFLFYVVKGYLL